MTDQQRSSRQGKTAGGRDAGDHLGASWRKSSHSNHQSACVEMARIDQEAVAFRDSKDPDGPVLIFTRSEAAAFIEDVAARRII
ncbi:DUF397 domain-containing protein [Streptomyces sp. NPDC051976]|uniref:DUF397 domain-containing protein n=1 Tax=Streptomyces sp. NPDC051976 TaxID=3154947 RepID=UPI00342850EA